MARDSAASGGTVERELEARAVSDLLDRAEEGPAGLLVEGEAGIGKTTLVLDAADRAVHRGFRVPAGLPLGGQLRVCRGRGLGERDRSRGSRRPPRSPHIHRQ